MDTSNCRTGDIGPMVDTLHSHHSSPDTKEAIVLLASRLGMGGAERHTITLANLLGKRFRVLVAYLKPEDEMIGLLDHAVLEEVRCLHAKKKIDLRAADELVALTERYNVRAVVCANAFALMYGHLARLRASKPFVVVEIFHTTKVRTIKEQFSLLFYRPFFWAAHHVVFVCNEQRRHWLRRALFGRRTHVIYNGVDLSHFEPTPYEHDVPRARAAFGFDIDDRVVGICAVLRPEKAHADLLSAVAQLRQQGQRWKILIIGDGPLRGEVEAEASRLGIGDDVKITGFMSDVRRSLACCDVVALVSTSESLSIAALEAMAMAKPMVMSDVGGAREQVHHGIEGFLFPAGNVTALASCLQQLWDKDVALRMGVAARKRVEGTFSLQAMLDRYVNLLQSSFNTVRGRITQESNSGVNTSLQASPQSGGETGAVRTRLLVVVSQQPEGDENEILHALSEQKLFDIRIVPVQERAQPSSVSFIESIYRLIDERAFQRQSDCIATSNLTMEQGDIATVLQRFQPAMIVDLVGLEHDDLLVHSTPILDIRLEGLPLRSLTAAVRGRVGTPCGVLSASVTERSTQGDRFLFGGSLFLDHRSLSRSVRLVARKLPMLIQGALLRRSNWQSNVPMEKAAKVAPAGPTRLLWRLGQLIVRRLLWRDQWRMVIFRDQKHPELANPWVTLLPDRKAFWADPFLVSQDDGTIVFFEELPYESGKGRISLINVDAQGRVGRPVAVLEQPWHLSYPHVFEWAGRLYMIPESLGNRTVDLYECEHFPHQWRFVKTLIQGQALADATLVQWQGRLWLFAAHAALGASAYDELHIFWANDLMGPWHPHALNPAKIDAGSARPAGAMFVEHGRLIRPTQDCRDRYGNGVCFQEVTSLDDNHFAEHQIDRLKPASATSTDSFHTYNAAGRYAVIDAAGLARRWSLNHVISRFRPRFG